jgi:hypothetical protein
MIRARMIAEDPDEIVFTLKVSMTVKEWCEIRDAIQCARDTAKGSYTAMRFSEAIANLLTDARRTFSYAEPDGKDALS